MATPFDSMNAIFYNKIEEDSNFFNYYGLSTEQSEALARQRADACLTEAATKLSLLIDADVDFSDYDADLREFAGDFNKEEQYLLASLQYEEYLLRDIAKLRANAMRFTSAEQKVFSPANERKTFQDMYEFVCQKNEEMVDRYCAKDRNSGALKMLEYESDSDE